jgi:uncharacterized protein (DUF2384 family)
MKYFHFSSENFLIFDERCWIMPAIRTEQETRVRERFRNLKIGNRSEMFVAATKGVRAGVFYELADIAGMSEKDLASTINLSARTVSNYRDNKKSFEPVYGEHLLKLIALYIKGEEIFGSVSEFNYWLNKPLWKSANKPLDWLITPGGIEMAIEEIEKIAQGYPI